MTLPFLILRPVETASKTAKRVQEMGLVAVIDPLFSVEKLAWTAPPPSDFDALMLTSANAVKYAGEAIERYKDLPVLAVGNATADAAGKCGFKIGVTGQGGVDELLSALPDGSYVRILRLSGQDFVEGVSPSRQITLRKTYQARQLSLGKKARIVLGQGCLVLLFSVRAVRTLEKEMDRLGLDRNLSCIAALSDSIAVAAGTEWKSVHTADRPSEDALLSLAAGLCSTQ